IEHQDVGQMDMYIRMYDELKCGKDDNPTIGILLPQQLRAEIERQKTIYSLKEKSIEEE
ncbi:MAG: DUF1016 domain-containing protein, partial [Bacteroidales bacterium]|nr:DUF1016 domain-containing protein [Bacteroidales bacterium]